MLKYVYIHSAVYTYTGKTMISKGMLTHTKREWIIIFSNGICDDKRRRVKSTLPHISTADKHSLM